MKQDVLSICRRERARVQRRTVAIELCSPTLSAFLQVVLGPHRPVSCTGAISFSYLACRTESERPANVNITCDGILAEFEAPHRPS